MEIIFEFIFQVVGEILLQSVAQVLFELGFYGLAETFKRKKGRNPFLATVGYLLWGGIIGALTLLIFPSLMIKNNVFRIVNLIFTPIVAGIVMSTIGSWRKKRGQDLLRIDSFIYGGLFAFGLAIVRFLSEIYFR